MRYDDNHKERTRARVLAEAAAAIRGKGVERVGVAEVMGGAGLTHGGFYAHFKSKDDLLTEAISYMFDDAYASFLRHTEGRAPADAKQVQQQLDNQCGDHASDDCTPDARLKRYVCHSSATISVAVAPRVGSFGLTVISACSQPY